MIKKLIKTRIHPLVWDKIGQVKKEYAYTSQKYHCDEILIPVFQKYFSKSNGFYVDIGASDGRAASNTYHLEKFQDWRGILVEPIMHVHFRSRQIRDLKRNIFFNCALVASDYVGKTVELLYSGLMTISKESTFNTQQWAEAGSKFLGSGEVVSIFYSLARTLESVLTEANAPNKIDLLSIDVEGAELSVLQGVDFSNWIFDYILIETSEGSAAYLTLIKEGYLHIESISQNLLFRHPSLTGPM
jgi:FkbM family methyltransferase